MCPVASAWDLPAPLNILNEKVFDDDWSIADDPGKPIVVWKDNCYGSSDCAITISAWIDIKGFRNESTINGTRYVNGSARDFAIIERGAKHHTPGNCVFVSFESVLVSVIDYEYDDGHIVTSATQESTFVYKEWICYWVGLIEFCYWQYYTDIFRVSYATDAPYEFNNTINNYEITITSYNNSVTPYTLLYMPSRENIIKQSVQYRNDTASWYNLTGLVKTNDRGAEHVRFLNETGYTIDENETITRRSEYFVINEAPLNWSLLNISVYTPYIVKNDTICNITIYNSKPSDFVAWKPLVTLIGILSSFLIGVGIANGRIQL